MKSTLPANESNSTSNKPDNAANTPQGKSSIFRLYQKYMLLVGIGGNTLFLFQAIKIFRTKSADDLSLIGFLVAFFALVSWLIYGLLIKDKPLIYVNAFGASAAFLCIIAILTAIA